MREMGKEFDPLAYIESAFLDKKAEQPLNKPATDLDVDVPSIGEFIQDEARNGRKVKFKRTRMSAPRPRRAKVVRSKPTVDTGLTASLEALPKMVAFLGTYYDDSVTANYYGGEFKESRQGLIQRLLDPQLTLEETSRLLGVCPATVRRYTNRNWLKHHRTQGGQRRFRLSDIVKFVEEHGRFPEES